MRALPLVAGLLLAASALAFAPHADARNVACTDVTNPTCPGFVCVDESLDGRYQWEECEPQTCTCPPPRDPW